MHIQKQKQGRKSRLTVENDMSFEIGKRDSRIGKGSVLS